MSTMQTAQVQRFARLTNDSLPIIILFKRTDIAVQQ
jgi:hypothetical protein